MNKTVFGGVVVAIFIILFVVVKTDTENPLLKKTKKEEPTFSSSVSSILKEFKKDNLRWQFEIKKKSSGLKISETSVILLLKDKRYEAGTYLGNCETRNSELFPGEIASYVVCLWEKEGIELGLFEENEKLFLKKGKVKGEEEYPAYRGDFKILREFDLRSF